MMKFLIFLLSISICYGKSLQIKPGLWSIEMKMKGVDGSTVDPMAQVKAALAKMPESQKKKMIEMMGKMGGSNLVSGGANSKGMEVCYTKEMIEDPESLAKNAKMEGNCKNTILTNTGKEVKTTFTCTDGTKGNSSWKISSESSYDGVINLDSPKRGKNSLTFSGRFQHEECGKKEKDL